MEPMDAKKLRQELEEYAKRILEIRRLSSLATDGISDASSYSSDLKNNFLKISEISKESRRVYGEVLVPLLKSENVFEDGIVSALQDFCDLLLDPFTEEDLDLTVLYIVIARLMQDAEEKRDDEYMVREYYDMINACYANMCRANRIRTDQTLALFFQNKGIDAARKILVYLEHDKFHKLSEDSKAKVLIQSRYYLALYDTEDLDRSLNEERVEGLWKSYELSKDPFYISETPNYDWYYHKIRCFEHMGQLTERGNAWGLTEKQCLRIAEGVDLLQEIYQENPPRAEEILPAMHLELITLRNQYFSGKIKLRKFQEELCNRYDIWANENYDMYSAMGNVFVPVELLSTIREGEVDQLLQESLTKIYRRLVSYVLHSNNTAAFNFLLEYVFELMEKFLELPGGISFEEMGLSLMAAIHAPTYVHSRQVAEISSSICRYLLVEHPEAFIGVYGTETVEDVVEMGAKILHHMHHGALCHDFGKLLEMDTIFVYGRRLTEEEYSVIKAHPTMGAYLLYSHEGTKEYAGMAYGHHRFYDGSSGYPTEDNPYEEAKIFIDILTIADCMDAATDTIGRNYNRGKTLEEVLEEFDEGAGTRYSPLVVKALHEESLLRDLKYHIGIGRQLNYHDTYLLLDKRTKGVM